MARQIIIDTETTGLEAKEGHRIIEIGCVELVDRKITGRQFHYYINPEREVEKESLEIHGLTNEFLSDKPKFAEVAEELFEFIKGSELIAHNAPFDVGFINHEVKLSKLNFGRVADHCRVFDTLKLARQMHPGQRNSLDALTKRYQVEHFNRELHGALLDAEILAYVYLAMTGGQAKLFDDDRRDRPVETYKEVTTAIDRKPLPVILASKAELKAHKDYLSLLDEKSEGQCVWEE